MATKCITFYSYKGGSGRSTTAINTVKALAKKMGACAEKPILLIDADIESAGLTYFLGQENNFCDSYTQSGTFHTTHVLNVLGPSSLPFDNGKKEIRTEAPSNFLNVFSDDDCFGKTRLSNDKPITAKELLAEVKLPLREWDIFRGILENYVAFNRHKIKILRHDPVSLVEELKREHMRPSCSAEQKIKLIHNFLPPRTFPDVSEFFGCAPGTILFLGVDVCFKGAQIARNDTVISQIDNLIYECTKRNYAAIVFDSGAGTQSTAHACHLTSDVIVYCMRPSSQFIDGTRNNIREYKPYLELSRAEKKEYKTSKNIIILPTAVPRTTELMTLNTDSFEKIENIVRDHATLVDGYFCDPQKALCEVELFKFKEYILGVDNSKKYSDEKNDIKKILQKYTNPDSPDFPEDAKLAYETYSMLAEKIIQNCEV